VRAQARPPRGGTGAERAGGGGGGRCHPRRAAAEGCWFVALCWLGMWPQWWWSGQPSSRRGGSPSRGGTDGCVCLVRARAGGVFSRARSRGFIAVGSDEAPAA
jgi:hypothetical protein